MNMGFLYLGNQAVGWLQSSGQLSEPLPLTQAGRSLSYHAKRDYLLQTLARFQPDNCAIVLDACSENISMAAPQKIHSERPFYISPEWSVSGTLQDSNNFKAAVRATAPNGCYDSHELSVVTRLRHGSDRAGLWPGSRQRHPAVSRRVVYPEQQQAFEWQGLLQDLLPSPVEIYSHTLITEFLLQPLFLDATAVMVVAQQPDASLRHLFLQNGWLRFSRLLPAQSEELSGDLDSSTVYVKQHIGFTDAFPIYYLSDADNQGGRRLQLIDPRELKSSVGEDRPYADGLPKEKYTEISHKAAQQIDVPATYAALETSLLQRQREFHFGVRRRAIDQLKRWRLQSIGMQQQDLIKTRERRTQTVVGAWIVAALILSLWQIASVVSLWQQKHLQEAAMNSEQSSQSLNTASKVKSAQRPSVSGWQMQQLVNLPSQKFKQSYVEPMAVLFRLQSVLSRHPAIILTDIRWQQQGNGTRLAVDLLQGYEGVQAGSSVPTSIANDRVSVTQPQSSDGVLQVFVQGLMEVAERPVLGVSDVSQYIADFDSFLQDLRNVMALQTIKRVTYPFGINPGSRLSLGPKAMQTAQRFVSTAEDLGQIHEQPDQERMGAFTFEIILPQSLLTELLLEISYLCEVNAGFSIASGGFCTETAGRA